MGSGPESLIARSCKALASTNMLTWAELQALVTTGQLSLWLPSGMREVPAYGRALYMLPAVYSTFQASPWLGAFPGERPQTTSDRRRALRMVLERYVKG